MPNRRPGLHLVFRSHGGDNEKDRPAFYSKLLGLASLIRAADAVEPHPQILFVNDGPIPADRLELMRRHGELVPIVAGSNRRSYRAAVALAAARATGSAGGSAWPDDDVVWFAEDDYLYGTESLSQLQSAAAALPVADYFSLWGRDALDPGSSRSRPLARPEPLSRGDRDATAIDGVRWYRALSTTSTFGLRVRALREDAELLRQLPYTGGAWDHATCQTVQGLQPFSWTQVRQETLPFVAHPIDGWPRSTMLGLTHLAANLRSRRRPGRRRRLYGSDPEMIFHMEFPTEANGRDWPEFAEQTRRWALDRQIPVDAGPR